ncbi:hypothetical protein KJS93_08275 [Flavihumibacter fluvii]|nr:hypothetical protein KJS93_08275 [Flavihumibacter fluvii]
MGIGLGMGINDLSVIDCCFHHFNYAL